MNLFETLESGIFKCPLRRLNNMEKHVRCGRAELEIAKKERIFPKEDLEILENLLYEEEEDVRKCKEGYDFSGCENCTNEYYLTGCSSKGCENLPKRILP